MLQPSRRRHGLLFALAILLAAASCLYGVIWMVAVRWDPTGLLGIDFDYVLEERCLIVEDVAEGSAADRAGIRAGDRIIAINGRSLASYDPILEDLSGGTPGSEVRLDLLRGDSPEALTLLAQLDPYPHRERPAPPRRVADELMGLFPLPFLLVGFTVLFLRVHDPHAWLLAIMLCGVVGGAPLLENLPGIPEDLRGFAFAYQILFTMTNGGMFYFFFTVFPYTAATIVPIWRAAVTDPDAVMR